MTVTTWLMHVLKPVNSTSVSSELRRCVDRGLDNHTELSYYQLEVAST